MKRTLFKCLTLFAVLAAAPAMAAETIKLMYAASLYADVKGSGLSRPDGAGCAKDNLLVVADTGNGRLLTYTYQQPLLTFAAEVKVPELTAPGKVQITSQGDILVMDEKQRRIARLGPDGSFRRYIDAAGLPGASTVALRSFALDAQDLIYLLDIAADRIVVLDAAGTFIRAITVPRDHGSPADVTVDPAGNVFVVDPVQARVWIAAAGAPELAPLSPSLREQLRFPTSIVADASGTLWVVDRHGGTVAVVDRSGNVQSRHLDHGWKEGLLRYPSQACVTENGALFIADRENNRVQVFTVVR
jgi:sugar lactone lactonase YvrE